MSDFLYNLRFWAVVVAIIWAGWLLL